MDDRDDKPSAPIDDLDLDAAGQPVYTRPARIELDGTKETHERALDAIARILAGRRP